MSEYAQRSGTRPSRADAVRAWTRHASQLASSSPASRPGPPAHETWHAALNQTPPVQAVAQLHCALNRSARVAHVAQLSSALQGKPREIVQGKLETLQRDGIEDEELLQGKFETAQRVEEDEERLQGQFHRAMRPLMDNVLTQRKKSKPDDNSDDAVRRFDGGNAAYSKSLDNGLKKWSLLLEGLAGYRSNRRDELVEKLRDKRAKYAETWRKHYRTSLVPGTNGVTEAHTKGVKEPNGIATKALPYFNKLHPKANTIAAAANYSEKDEAREAKVGLSNSEILWRQYLEVVKQDYGHLEERALNKMAQLEHLLRLQVSTPATKMVVHIAYPDGMSWKENHRTWLPGEQEFLAILGTENVVPAVWLLIDHMDELDGKTIASITTLAPDVVDVRFGPDPKAYDLEDEWKKSAVRLEHL